MAENQKQIRIQVRFYSFFKDLAGCAGTSELVPAGSALGELVKRLVVKFPKLGPMQKSMLVAVGVEYQDRTYILQDGDEVSLFPPVQGG
ncbi:MAG TPA: MoaD/ThiS family protein [Verrucomicrobiae bacterium]|nr:MoaD/ThiS family protein [Verrucomicrobiae bacterium]